MNVYQNIRRNNLKTALLVAAFPVLFIFIMWLAFFVAALIVGQEFPAQVATWGAVRLAIPTAIVCLIWMGISWLFGDSMMLSSAGAHELNGKDPDYRHIYKEVENVAIAAGLPTPRVYIMEEDGLNAFATGRGPGDASVAVTRGLVQTLNRAELRGVIAHEMAHIQNRDIRLDMLLVTGVGATIFAADLILRYLAQGGGSQSSGDDKSRGMLMAMLIAALVGLWLFNLIIAPILRMAISRTREFGADATGALLTRDPKSLADALRKISCKPEMDVKHNMAAACIANPIKEFASSLFSTHPDTGERIARLEKM